MFINNGVEFSWRAKQRQNFCLCLSHLSVMRMHHMKWTWNKKKTIRSERIFKANNKLKQSKWSKGSGPVYCFIHFLALCLSRRVPSLELFLHVSSVCISDDTASCTLFSLTILGAWILGRAHIWWFNNMLKSNHGRMMNASLFLSLLVLLLKQKTIHPKSKEWTETKANKKLPYRSSGKRRA